MIALSLPFVLLTSAKQRAGDLNKATSIFILACL